MEENIFIQLLLLNNSARIFWIIDSGQSFWFLEYIYFHEI